MTNRLDKAMAASAMRKMTVDSIIVILG
jgi:hypothetical protein